MSPLRRVLPGAVRLTFSDTSVYILRYTLLSCFNGSCLHLHESCEHRRTKITKLIKFSAFYDFTFLMFHVPTWDGRTPNYDPEVHDKHSTPASRCHLFGGSTLTPLRTPDSIFLLNQYIYVQLYAAYASIETDVI